MTVALTPQELHDPKMQAFMRHVCNTMALGLVISGAVNYLATHVPFLAHFFFGFPMLFIILFAPLGFLYLGFTPHHIARMPPERVQMAFAGYSALMGLFFPCLFWFFDHTRMGPMFFISALAYGALSLYGYRLKRDIGDMTSFLVMGGAGAVLSLLFQIIHPDKLEFFICLFGAAAFTGVTAWETHILKESFSENRDMEQATARFSMSGALLVYMTFISMFQSLVNLSFTQPRGRQ